MANFKEAFKSFAEDFECCSYIVMNDGEEAYMGISRKYHPTWEGWNTVDDLSYDKEEFPKNLDLDDELQELVHKFYEMRFWDESRLDEFDSQELASNIFSLACYHGTRGAGQFLQMALNYLSEGDSYDKINENGVVEDDTIDAVNVLEDGGYTPLLIDTIYDTISNTYVFEVEFSEEEVDCCCGCGMEECGCDDYGEGC
jgi:lysozyme family protein